MGHVKAICASRRSSSCCISTSSGVNRHTNTNTNTTVYCVWQPLAGLA